MSQKTVMSHSTHNTYDQTKCGQSYLLSRRLHEFQLSRLSDLQSIGLLGWQSFIGHKHTTADVQSAILVFTHVGSVVYKAELEL